MATTGSGISTESEAKTKLGLSQNPDGYYATRAITKSRVLGPFGGSLYNANTYNSSLCVKYSDIYMSSPSLNDYCYCHELAIMDTLCSSAGAPPASEVPLRLDSDFGRSWYNIGTNSYCAIYNSWSNDTPPQFPYKLSPLSYYEGYIETLDGTPSDNTGNWHELPTIDAHMEYDNTIFAISGCTPDSQNIPITSTFNAVHSYCINSSIYQYPDYNQGHAMSSALGQEFGDGDSIALLHYPIIGTPYYNAPNSYATYCTHNGIVANLKFGQLFYIVLNTNDNKGDFMFSYTFYLLEYVDDGILSGSHNHPYYEQVNDLVGMYPNDICYSYIYYDISDKCLKIEHDINLVPGDVQNCDGILFTIEHMYSYNGLTYILKIKRTGNNIVDDKKLYPLITPYMTNIAIGLKDGDPVENEDINLWYNYDDSESAGWQNIYNDLALTLEFMGLDTCAMYQIRFITNYNDSMPSESMYATIVKNNEYEPIPIAYCGHNIDPTPYFFDLCIPNPKSAFPIEERVSDLKLDPSKNLYISGFALSYVRAPIIINTNFKDIPNSNASFIAYTDDNIANSTFIYENIMKRFFGHNIPTVNDYEMLAYMTIAIHDIFKLDNTQSSIDIAIRSLLASVPYIFVKCENVDDASLTNVYDYFDTIWDFGKLNDEISKYFGFHPLGGSIEDYLFPLGHISGGGRVIGIPEFLFFHAGNSLEKNIFENRINVVDRPRAVNIVIPLDAFGEYYNLKYSDPLDEMYVYYKTYFYHYRFV